VTFSLVLFFQNAIPVTLEEFQTLKNFYLIQKVDFQMLQTLVKPWLKTFS